MSAEEAALARSAALKALHRPLRRWFRALPAAESEPFAPFPMFWNELADWAHLKEVQKMYEDATREDEEAGDEPVVVDAAPDAAGTGNNNNKKKKRKSRFASAGAPAPSSDSSPSTTGEDAGEGPPEGPGTKRRRKSRFSSNTDGADAAAAPGPGAGSDGAGATKRKRRSRFTAPTLTSTQRQLTILHARLADLHTQLMNVEVAAAAKERADPSIVDAVKPEYDSNGKRTNRLVDRMRAELNERRKATLREMVKINPSCKAKLIEQGCSPDDFLIVKKMYIPTEDFPGYNFFGLIIGPRGKTQKEMEAKAGVKISIRGKGSVKEGARGRRSTKPDPGANEPLHVKITGESEEGIAIATKLIEPLLNPCADADNAHKQAQLRELALINGTLRTEVYCQICGEKGHRQFECPMRHKIKAGGGSGVVSAGVRCAICGDTSHVTADCKLTREEVAAGARERESDFQGFLADLGDESAQRQVEMLKSVGAGRASNPSAGGGGGEPSRNVNKGGVVEILGLVRSRAP